MNCCVGRTNRIYKYVSPVAVAGPQQTNSSGESDYFQEMRSKAAHFQETKSEAEELMRRLSSKWDIGEIAGLMCAGVFFLLHGALVRSQTKSDRTMSWILAGVSFLIGGAIACRVLYMRRKLERILAEMRSASLDLECAGELRTRRT